MKSHHFALLSLSSFCLMTINPALADTQANSKGSLTLACSQTQQKNHGSDITFQAKTNRQKYKIGDNMTLSVTPDKAALITIIDHGSDPANTKLNNFLFQNVMVQKGETYVFPDPSSGVDMRISGPAGGNTFEVIASTEVLLDPNAHSKNVELVERVEPTQVKQRVNTTNCMLKFEITE